MKKILNLIKYIFIIRNNKKYLYQKHNLKINWLYQLYTVISLPPERHKNAVEFGVNGYPYLNEEVEKYTKELDVTLMRIGLFELIGIKEMTKLDDINVKFVLTYAFLDLNRLFRNVIITILLSAIISLLILI